MGFYCAPKPLHLPRTLAPGLFGDSTGGTNRIEHQQQASQTHRQRLPSMRCKRSGLHVSAGRARVGAKAGARDCHRWSRGAQVPGCVVTRYHQRQFARSACRRDTIAPSAMSLLVGISATQHGVTQAKCSSAASEVIVAGSWHSQKSYR